MKRVMCEERQALGYLLGASELFLEAQVHHLNQEDQAALEDPGRHKHHDYLLKPELKL